MEIKTRYHGIINYSKEDVITFPKGLFGFEDLHSFIKTPIEENEMFTLLHSLEDSNIGLITISPFSICKDYSMKLDNTTIEELKINSPEEVLILNTVTLNSKIENITVNLKAPIVINIKTMLGKQLILEDDKYNIKHPLVRRE